MSLVEEGEFFLRKDSTSTTYELLLRRAREEGRVGGKSTCQVCGMKYNGEQEALDCCRHFWQTGR